METAMPKAGDAHFFGAAFKRALLVRVLPRITEFPQGDRDEVLSRARETRFDIIEWVGVLAGVALVTWLLRFGAGQAATFSLPILYFVQFVAAAPLLLLVVGPFYLRCTLRGLDEEIERRRIAGRSEPRR